DLFFPEGEGVGLSVHRPFRQSSDIVRTTHGRLRSARAPNAIRPCEAGQFARLPAPSFAPPARRSGIARRRLAILDGRTNNKILQKAVWRPNACRQGGTRCFDAPRLLPC